jgi:precorrin-2 dehydrogenase/sirohydrochlorin ferrochelatase
VPDYFLISLDLRGHRCLVVGGGVVGERRVRDLLACGAAVTVVSPALTTGLAGLARSAVITWKARRFVRTDIRRCRVVMAATGMPRVDENVAREARRCGALVNVVDRPAACDFIVPSVLRRGELQIAVSTGGRSPALARDIRRRLESQFGPEYGDLVERVGQARIRARADALTRDERLAAGERVVKLAFGEHTHGSSH